MTDANDTLNTGADDTSGQGTGDAKQGSNSTDDKSSTAQAKAPEAYAAFTLPDAAKEMQVDPGFLERFTADAKAMNLTQEAAQERFAKMVELDLQLKNEIDQANKKAWEAQVDAWGKETQKLPDYAQDKAVGERAAALVFEKIPELKELVDKTGYGNHPAVFKLFALMGKTMMEPDFTTGAAERKGPLSEEERAKKMYPSMGR